METAQLTRKLNLSHTLAIIVGTVIGSGVFINVPVVAKVTGSPLLAAIAWLVGGLIWIPQVLVMAEMATAYPEEGFGYLYLKKAGSKFLAFLYVWTVFWTSDTPSISILAAAAASALAVFYPPLDGTLIGKGFAVLIIVVLTAVHYRDVKMGGNLQIVLTVIKVSPLILLVFLGFAHYGSGQLFLHPTGEAAQRGILTLLLGGMAATVWSYSGFPNVLYMAGEIKNPHRNLPKALIGSTIGVMVVYVLVALGTSAIVPHGEVVASTGSFANPFRYLPLFASIAAGFLAVSAFISMVGCNSACIMVQPRIEYAIARDGLFPKFFGHVHPRFATPDFSILIQSGLAVVLVFLTSIENLLGYFTLSYLIQNAIVYLAIFILRKKSDYRPTFKAPLWWLMAGFSIAVTMGLAYGTFIAYPAGGAITAAALIATGFPVYFFFRNRPNPYAEGPQFDLSP
ncbi:amino acid permease [candidate division KSB1 bacterium]|nr:amino acid permease [candidate division KSB1 bacterium]